MMKAILPVNLETLDKSYCFTSSSKFHQRSVSSRVTIQSAFLPGYSDLEREV
jgi:hypothetical protein